MAEKVQLRVSRPFLARHESELEKGCDKVNWSAWLPMKEYEKYQFPYVNAKTHASELYHTRKVTDIVKMHLNDIPYKVLYKQ